MFAASQVGHWIVTSCGSCVAPPASPMKHGATLLAQLAGNYARRADTPLARSIPALQFKIPATDAVCIKVALSLTFCAHSSLQSFSTSDKMKGPKTGPPGGTTFDPKRVHFWVPSEIHLLCARVQNWALSILNLAPPWGLV